MTDSPAPQARLFGVGTGPGDPDLLTVKAARLIETADVIAYFAKRGHDSHARRAVAARIPAAAIDLPLLYPVTTELDRKSAAYTAAIGGFFDDAAAAVAGHLDAGRRVVVLSEGDPLFYGSYMHIHHRLAGRYPTEVVAGVTAMSGCWSAAGVPICQGDDIVTVLPATLEAAELTRRLVDSEAAIIMKLGRHLPKVRQAIHDAGRLADATYVARGTMADSEIIPLAEIGATTAPYFALVLVAGWRDRP